MPNALVVDADDNEGDEDAEDKVVEDVVVVVAVVIVFFVSVSSWLLLLPACGRQVTRYATCRPAVTGTSLASVATGSATRDRNRSANHARRTAGWTCA